MRNKISLTLESIKSENEVEVHTVIAAHLLPYMPAGQAYSVVSTYIKNYHTLADSLRRKNSYAKKVQ